MGVTQMNDVHGFVVVMECISILPQAAASIWTLQTKR
jgi:hypothetical protein